MRKLTKDIRFVAAIFVLVFVVLGIAAVNASTGDNESPVYGEKAELAYTTAFYFKSSELRLDIDSKPNTSFLVIENQAAIINANVVVGSAVEVSLNPFTITVVKEGTSQIEISARIRSGEIKAISCTVIVKDLSNESFSSDETNHGTSDETENGTNGGNSDSSYTGELLYEFESTTVIAFSLFVGDNEVSVFTLTAELLEGNVTVGIIGRKVRIKYLSEDTNFVIRVTAKVDGKLIAELDVQNYL